MFEKFSESQIYKNVKRIYKSCFKWSRDKVDLIKYCLATYYNPKIRSFLWKLGFISGLIYLSYQNWSTIINYDKIADQQGLLNVIQTPANLFVFKFGIVYALATVTYFLLKLPFQKIESLKVSSSGVEYKTVAENAKVADETLTALREAEYARMNILNTLSTPHVMNTIKSLVNRNEINMAGGISLIAGIMQAYLLSSLNVKLHTSVIGVVNDVPEQDEYDRLKVNIQLLINEIVNEETPWLIHEGRHSVIVVRFKWEAENTDYCILCLEADSKEWLFSKADYLLLDTAWNIIKRSLLLYRRKNSAIIVSKRQANGQGGDSK